MVYKRNILFVMIRNIENRANVLHRGTTLFGFNTFENFLGLRYAARVFTEMVLYYRIGSIGLSGYYQPSRAHNNPTFTRIMLYQCRPVTVAAENKVLCLVRYM
jgi:hypothetical protein